MSPEPSAHWVRLDRHDAGLPPPAVYLPQRDLAPATPAALSFALAADLLRDGRDLPLARGLIADVSDPERLALLAYDPDASLPAGDGGRRRAVTAPLATGTFATPAPSEWIFGVIAANNVIIVSGPAEPARLRPRTAGALPFTPGRAWLWSRWEQGSSNPAFPVGSFARASNLRP